MSKIKEHCTTQHEIRVCVVFEFVQTIHKLNIRNGYPGPTVMNMLGATRDRH